MKLASSLVFPGEAWLSRLLPPTSRVELLAAWLSLIAPGRRSWSLVTSVSTLAESTVPGALPGTQERCRVGSGLGCCCEEEGAGFSSPTSLLGGSLSLAGRLVTWSAFRSRPGAGPAPSHRFGSWSGRLFSVVCLSLPFLFRSLASLLKRRQFPSFGSFSSVCITFSFLFYSLSLQHLACGSVHLSVSFCISDWFFSHTYSVRCGLKRVGSVKVWFWSCVLSVRQWDLQT